MRDTAVPGVEWPAFGNRASGQQLFVVLQVLDAVLFGGWLGTNIK